MKDSTEQNYRRRIARVIEAIIVDPAAPHSVESLAALAHFSPFHFHRIYRALTGESVAATVRRVRLVQAANRLKDGGASVTEAAIDAGYDSTQSFARAFRDLTGLSPTGFQAQQQALTVDRPAVTIVEWPATTIFALRHDGPITTIPHCYRRLQRWAVEHGLCWSELPRIGIGYGDPEQDEGFHYLAGLMLSAGFTDADGLERHELPGGRYGTYRLIGSHTLIAPTFQALFGGWLPQSGLEPDDRPALELYHQPTADSAHVTDLLIPIRETNP
jgi:AraC family transcriptional regulator